MIEYRRLENSQLDRIGEIDRAEDVSQAYVVRDGVLTLRDVDWNVPRWTTGNGEHSVSHKLAEWRPWLEDGGELFGAVDGANGSNLLVGVAIYRPNVRPGTGQLALLHVSRDYRRAGVGRRLCAMVFDAARHDGAGEIYVSATETRGTVDFYRSLGFELTPNPIPELYDLEPEDIHMTMPVPPAGESRPHPAQPRWLEWAQRLQAIAQTGLEYSRDNFDIERFHQVRELSVEIMESYTDIGREKLRDLFANESGYQTPKVDVRAVVERDGGILMVREITDGKWAMPGGWADIGLSLKENTEKEVAEEAGMHVHAERLIAVLDRNRHVHDNYPYSVYRMFVACRLDKEVPGGFAENIETSDAGFFREDELPKLSLLRNTPEQVAMCFAFLRGELPDVLMD